MLSWFNTHPAAIWLSAAMLLLAAVIQILAPLRNWEAEENTPASAGSGLLLLAVLVAFRWPLLFVVHEFNPDESQFIAGAHTLAHDPVFWRAVDGGTAGPLAFFALWPVSLITGSFDYFSARLTGLLLLGATLWFAEAAVALVFGRFVARLAVLPTLCFYALSHHVAFVHYSSETFVMSLLAASAWLGLRLVTRGGGSAAWCLLGGLLGAVPFAKLQGLPLVAGLGLGFALWEALNFATPRMLRLRRLLWMAGGSALPFGALALMLSVTHQWNDAIRSYVVGNFHYAGAFSLSLTEAFGSLWVNGCESQVFAPWIISSLVFFVAAANCPRDRSRLTLSFGAFATGCLLAGLVCILTPHRAFAHYWHFLALPWVLFTGAMLGGAWQALPKKPAIMRPGFIGGYLMLTVLPLVARIPWAGHPHLGLEQGTPRQPIAEAIRQRSRPGDRLAVWGWSPCFYVESGLIQAIRYGGLDLGGILKGPDRLFHLKHIIADLRTNCPAFFVDSVEDAQDYNCGLRILGNAGGGDTASQSQAVTHNLWPELGAFVAKNYTLTAEFNGSCLYVRKDRATPRAAP